MRNFNYGSESKVTKRALNSELQHSLHCAITDIYFIIICLFIYVSVQVYGMFVRVPAEAKRGSVGSLELELQAVESHLTWVLGIELCSPGRAANALN